MLKLMGTDRAKINGYHMLPDEGIEQGYTPIVSGRSFMFPVNDPILWD